MNTCIRLFGRPVIVTATATTISTRYYLNMDCSGAINNTSDFGLTPECDSTVPDSFPSTFQMRNSLTPTPGKNDTVAQGYTSSDCSGKINYSSIYYGVGCDSHTCQNGTTQVCGNTAVFPGINGATIDYNAIYTFGLVAALLLFL